MNLASFLLVMQKIKFSFMICKFEIKKRADFFKSVVFVKF